MVLRLGLQRGERTTCDVKNGIYGLDDDICFTGLEIRKEWNLVEVICGDCILSTSAKL